MYRQGGTAATLAPITHDRSAPQDCTTFVTAIPSHPHCLLLAYREALYDKVLPPTLLPAIIGHPNLHLCIMVAQILPPFDEMPEWQLKAMFWIFLVRFRERGAE